MFRRLLWLLLGAVLLAAPSVVFAHALLERAEPPSGSVLEQAPAELRLYFSEPLDPSFSRVQVLNAQRDVVYEMNAGQNMPDDRTVVLRLSNGLPNGVYTVGWRTLSLVDGHTATGSYPLVVGPLPEGVALTETATSEARFAPETAVARWLFFVTAGALFGTLLAWQVVFMPLLGRSTAAAQAMAVRNARRLAIVSAVLLLAATLYGAVAQASVAADVPIWDVVGRPLFDVLGRGRYAALWWLRLASVLLALAIVTWRGIGGWDGKVALGAVAVALLTSSLNSHSAALLSGAYLGIIADWLHFLGAAAWVGGLASLVFVLPVAVRGAGNQGDRLLAQFVARFSNLALISIARDRHHRDLPDLVAGRFVGRPRSNRLWPEPVGQDRAAPHRAGGRVVQPVDRQAPTRGAGRQALGGSGWPGAAVRLRRPRRAAAWSRSPSSPRRF